MSALIYLIGLIVVGLIVAVMTSCRSLASAGT
jgi:hypothetical protein